MDCVQIDFLRFAKAFHPLMSEYSEVRGEFVFNLLDVDHDGKLNILNIIQIHHNLISRGGEEGTCLLAIEMKKLFNEYKERNVHMKLGFRN
jgi:Ca2+-binding EF-hand superfamily protein